MEFGSFKPVLASLVLPPVSLLLLAVVGLLLAARKKRAGLTLVTIALALLWLLSCHGAAVWLARTALPQFAPLSVAQLKTANVQAIVVLGGGLLPQAPEYGEPQLGTHSASRLRYGLWLARQSGLPLAFSGGVGWAAKGITPASEAGVAARTAELEYGFKLRWVESKSRDTAENAQLMAPILKRDGVTHIALVTHAWHMQRATAAFERAGLVVSPAPTGYVLPVRTSLLEWLPSASGLEASSSVLREWLALGLAN